MENNVDITGNISTYTTISGPIDIRGPIETTCPTPISVYVEKDTYPTIISTYLYSFEAKSGYLILRKHPEGGVEYVIDPNMCFMLRAEVPSSRIFFIMGESFSSPQQQIILLMDKHINSTLDSLLEALEAAKENRDYNSKTTIHSPPNEDEEEQGV